MEILNYFNLRRRNLCPDKVAIHNIPLPLTVQLLNLYFHVLQNLSANSYCSWLDCPTFGSVATVNSHIRQYSC
jgi:hypothetical protein